MERLPSLNSSEYTVLTIITPWKALAKPPPEPVSPQPLSRPAGAKRQCPALVPTPQIHFYCSSAYCEWAGMTVRCASVDCGWHTPSIRAAYPEPKFNQPKKHQNPQPKRNHSVYLHHVVTATDANWSKRISERSDSDRQLRAVVQNSRKPNLLSFCNE